MPKKGTTRYYNNRFWKVQRTTKKVLGSRGKVGQSLYFSIYKHDTRGGHTYMGHVDIIIWPPYGASLVVGGRDNYSVTVDRTSGSGYSMDRVKSATRQYRLKTSATKRQARLVKSLVSYLKRSKRNIRNWRPPKR